MEHLKANVNQLVGEYLKENNMAPTGPLPTSVSRALLSLLAETIGGGDVASLDVPSSNAATVVKTLWNEAVQRNMSSDTGFSVAVWNELKRVNWMVADLERGEGGEEGEGEGGERDPLSSNKSTTTTTTITKPQPTKTPSMLLEALATATTRPGGDQTRVKPYANPDLGTEVLKLSEANFFRRKLWQKRFLVVDAEGMGYFSSAVEATKSRKDQRRRLITWNQVERLERVPQHEAQANVLIVSKTGGECKKFAFSSQAELDAWTAAISTYVLIDAVVHTLGEIPGTSPASPRARNRNALLEHLIDECNANVDGTIMNSEADDPLVLKAVQTGNLAAADLLLRRGANARRLLNLDTGLDPTAVLTLFERAGRDLNVVSADVALESGWSLLHHFVARREELGTIVYLLQRVDVQTVRAQTKGSKSSALSLAMTRLPHDVEGKSGDYDKRWGSYFLPLITMLLEHGADPNARVHSSSAEYGTNLGDACFHTACKDAKMTEVALLMIDKCSGLDINACDSGGDAPVHLALKCGHLGLAKKIALDPRFHIDLRDSHGDSTLILAMKLGYESFALFLLSRGADGNKGWGGMTDALRARGGSKGWEERLKTGEALRMSERVEVDSHADRPIHLAIKLRMTNLALKIVETTKELDLRAQDARGRTPLQLSILHNMIAVSHALVARSSNEDLVVRELGPSGDTALHLAIRCGRLELACALVDRANAMEVFNARNAMGEAPLHAAIFALQSAKRPHAVLAAIAAMIAKGASVRLASSPPASQTPLHLACSIEKGSESFALMFNSFSSSSSGGDEALFHALQDRDGRDYTVLGAALEAKNTACVSRILSHPVARRVVNARCGPRDESQLHIAVRRGFVSAIGELLAKGAYASQWNVEGATPLIACVSSHFQVDVCRALIKGVAAAGQLNAREEEKGHTPLMAAVLCGNFQAVQWLLESQADPLLLEPKTRSGIFTFALNNLGCEGGERCARILLDHLSAGKLPDLASEGEVKARVALESRLTSGIPSPIPMGSGTPSLASQPPLSNVLPIRTPSVSGIASVNNLNVTNNSSNNNNGGAAPASGTVGKFKKNVSGIGSSVVEKKRKQSEKEIPKEGDEDGRVPDDSSTTTGQSANAGRKAQPGFRGRVLNNNNDNKDTGTLINFNDENKSGGEGNTPTLEEKEPEPVDSRENEEDESFMMEQGAALDAELAKNGNARTTAGERSRGGGEREDSFSRDELNKLLLSPISSGGDDLNKSLVMMSPGGGMSKKVRALEQVQHDARETAEAWIATEEGSRMMRRNATKILREKPGEQDVSMSEEEAVEVAKRNFISQHIDEQVKEFVALYKRRSSKSLGGSSAAVSGGATS